MKRWLFIIAVVLWGASAFGQVLKPRSQGELWGFADGSGRFVIQPVYQKVSEFHNGIAVVIKDNSIGWIDPQGKEVVRTLYAESPTKFGEVCFQPNYRGERQYISWMRGANEQVGIIWITRQGKILVTSAKVLYDLTDKIPDKLWDY